MPAKLHLCPILLYYIVLIDQITGKKTEYNAEKLQTYNSTIYHAKSNNVFHHGA